MAVNLFPWPLWGKKQKNSKRYWYARQWYQKSGDAFLSFYSITMVSVKTMNGHTFHGIVPIRPFDDVRQCSNWLGELKIVALGFDSHVPPWVAKCERSITMQSLLWLGIDKQRIWMHTLHHQILQWVIKRNAIVVAISLAQNCHKPISVGILRIELKEFEECTHNKW